jgi:hypothetical protein|nr:MAG TPA: hypothetical protein [Bacteriophage sp.]
MNYNVTVNPDKFIVATAVENNGNILTAKLFNSPVIKNDFDEILRDWYQNQNAARTFLKISEVRYVYIGKYKVDILVGKLCDSDLPELVKKEISEFVSRACRIGDNEIAPESFLKFLENLEENPSRKTINNLYSFIGHNDIEIDKDGYVICYKVIREDWTDSYTGTINNSIGSLIKMPRNQIDDDDNRTCSKGLHAASLRYLRSSGYGQSPDGKWRLVKLRVNPRNFVSVPIDYDGSKARVCEYEVIEECDKSLLL